MYYVLSLIAALHARADEAKDRGATATEYALLVALIAIAIVAAVTVFGSQLSTFFDKLGSKVAVWAGSIT
jgi:pilus assembly protein Flp/PilA